jgi:exosortase/archaeosortase family protein
VLFILTFYSLTLIEKKTQKAPTKKKIYVWILFVLNFLFSFIIGLSQQMMISPFRDNMPIVLLPLLIILNYVIIDRFHYYTNKSIDKVKLDEFEKIEKNQIIPVIEFEGRKYVFSKTSITVLAIGAPLSAYLIYLFFDLEINYWLHEIVVKQTVFFLNLFFNMNASAQFAPTGSFHWNLLIPGRSSIYFETFCTGVQAIVIFVGIIVFTPHSKDPQTKKDIIWRKTKSLVISSAIFYVVNIARMIIQLWLYYIGYAWNDIHYSISAASSFIAAIIVLLMHKWIPEFILTFIYTGALIKRKIKGKKDVNSKESNEIKELKIENK